MEPAEQLLERIKTERVARHQQQLDDWQQAVKVWEAAGKEGKKPAKPKKLKDLPALTVEELVGLPSLPEGWCWQGLSEISESIQIGPFGSLLHKADYISGGTPLVNPSHIKDERIAIDSTLTVTSDKLLELPNYVMKTGDIVMGRRGEMGRCAVVSSQEQGYLCGTGSLFIRLLVGNTSYLYCKILGSQRVKYYLSNSSIGTTMMNLNQKILHRLPVPVCSPSEQYEIVNCIEQQQSVIDQLETDIQTNLKKSEALRQSILKKAFSGQLVSQNPDDEPASALLARIKAEREAAEQATKAAKKAARKTAKAST